MALLSIYVIFVDQYRYIDFLTFTCNIIVLTKYSTKYENKPTIRISKRLRASRK